jgi:hypothetical protein
MAEHSTVEVGNVFISLVGNDDPLSDGHTTYCFARGVKEEV